MDEQEIKQPVEDGKDAASAKHEEAQPKENAVTKDANASDVFAQGETINDSYVIEKLIGRGGMGEIYRAKDVVLGTDVAIKVVSKSFGKENSYALDMLRNEAKKSASLRHKNIVSVLGLKHEERKDVWYVIMEFIDGGSLHSILDRQQVVSEEQAIIIVEEIANALNSAAELKIAHRDIKPDNIMFTSRGEVKLADLGIARHYGSGSLNSTKTVGTGFNAGTLAYIAPEQLLNPDNYDIRSDIYSLGVTFYEMITGHTPFVGSPSELREQILNTPAPDPRKSNPEISEWCANLVLRMLEKDPDNRFSNPKELIETIDKGPYSFNVLQREELMEKLVAGEHATVIDSKTSWSSSKFTEGRGATLLFKLSMAVMVFSLAVLLAFAVLLYREWHAKQGNTVIGVDDKFKSELNNTAGNAREQIVNLLEEIVKRIDAVVDGTVSQESLQNEKTNDGYKKAVSDAKETQIRLVELSKDRDRLPESNPEERSYKNEAEAILTRVQKELNGALYVQEKVSNAGKIYWAFVNGDRTAHDALENIALELNEIKQIASEIESDSNEVHYDAEQTLILVNKVRAVENSLDKSIKLLKAKLNDGFKTAEQKPVAQEVPKPEEPKPVAQEEPKTEEPKPVAQEEPKPEDPKPVAQEDQKPAEQKTVEQEHDDVQADAAEKAAIAKALVDGKVKIIRDAYNAALEKKNALGNVGDLDRINEFSTVVVASIKNAEEAQAAMNESGYDAAQLKALQDEAKVKISQLRQWGTLADFMKNANVSLKAASTSAYLMMKAKDAMTLDAEFKSANDALDEIDRTREALKMEVTPEVTFYANEAGLLKKDIDCVRTIMGDCLLARKAFEGIKDKKSIDDAFRMDGGFRQFCNVIKERKKHADTTVLSMNKGDLRNKAKELIDNIGEWEKAMLGKPSDDLEEKATQLLKDAEAKNKALETAKELLAKGEVEFSAAVFGDACNAKDALKRAMEGIGETLASKEFVLAEDNMEKLQNCKNDFERLSVSLANNADDFAAKAKVDVSKAEDETASLRKQTFQWIDEEHRKKAFDRMEVAMKRIREAIESRDLDEKWWKERRELMGLMSLLDVMSNADLALAENRNVLLADKFKPTKFCKALDAVCNEIEICDGESATELLGVILKNLSSFKNALEKDYKANLAKNSDVEKRYNAIREKLESIEEKTKR